jgi:malonate decarboxylase alpha subunit
MATRDWLAAKTIDDLVTASGGLYMPPPKFRPAMADSRLSMRNQL